MEKKNNTLNQKYEDKRRETCIVEDLKNMDFIPKYLCFTGTIYQVVKDNGVKKPEFVNPIHEKVYAGKFVCDRLVWHKTFDNDSVMLGSFNLDDTDWFSDAYGSIGTDQLCEFISKGDTESIIKLIESVDNDPEALDILLNSRDVSNRNPLHFAISMSNIDICRILLDKGANPMATSKLYKNALHTAYSKGNLDIIKLLLEIGPKYQDFDPMKQDSYGLTPIMYTIMYGHTEAFKYLYENTVKSDTSLVWIFKLDKSKSYRALEMCLLYKRYDIAEYLLSKGYNIHDYYLQDKKALKTKARNHIMNQAIMHRDITFIKLLIDKNGYETYKEFMKLEDSLITSAKTTKSAAHLKYVIDLICYLCKLNSTETKLIELIMHFVEKNDMENLKYLIEVKKVNVNYAKNSLTALDYVLNTINMRYIESLNKEFRNKVNSQVQNLQGELNEIVYAISNSKDASDLVNDEKNKWLISKPKVTVMTKETMSDTTQLNVMKDYLLSMGAQTFNDINGISTLNHGKSVKTGCFGIHQSNGVINVDMYHNAHFEKPFTLVQFKDLDGNVMYNTERYIELYTAIKENDLETILNLTVNAERKNMLHLAVYYKTNITPLSIAMCSSYELIPELVKIMEMQTIKQKEKKKTSTKLYINNKFDSKKKKAKDDVDEAELYEEELITEVNKFAVTKFSVNEIFRKYDFIKLCINNYNSLEVLLGLNNESVNNLLYNNLAMYLTLSIKNLKCTGLLIKHYSSLLSDTYKYNMSDVAIKELILRSNSQEVLYYFLNEGKKMWSSEVKSYPFADVFKSKTILHVFAEMNINDKDNFDDILIELLLLDGECDSIKYKDKLPIQCVKDSKNLMALVNVFYTKDKLLTDLMLEHESMPLIHSIVFKFPKNFEQIVGLIGNDFSKLVNLTTSTKNQTLLMLAIKKLDISIATKLIETYKIDQSVTDVFGNTALHYAMYYNRYPVIKLLTLHSQENHFRMTPQDYIINKMRSTFHHVRNDKLGSSFNPKELYYIISIYNDFILGKDMTRVFTCDDNIKKVNDYIMDKLKNANGTIPDTLQL